MSKYQWNRRILIVDDEVEIAKGYREILCPTTGEVELASSRSSGNVLETNRKSDKIFDVDIAHSYQEAMQLLNEAFKQGRPYSVGFFDVILGESRDGIDLVKEFFSRDSDIYAVFVTAYQDRSVDSIRSVLKEKCLERWDYLNKPLNDGELLQKARNFNALWNLKKEKTFKEEELNSLRRRIFESEKSTSIAAISRSVTHEFGNVLMQIMGKADISRKKSEADMRQALEVILEASVRAAKILDRFKSVNGVEQGDEKTEVYLQETIQKCLELMEQQISSTQTIIKVQFTENIKIKANSTSLMQVLLNVFINAIQAMEPGGEICVDISRENGMAKIVIIDSGEGVSSDILDQILVPFFTTKGSKGSGLGLAICKEIVEIEHGGEFEVKNGQNRGLEAVIRLPINCPLKESA